MTKSYWIQTIYTAGFCITPFALIAEQFNAQRHKPELPSG